MIWTIPVLTKDAVKMSSPRIIIAVSLPNPLKAVSAGRMPVRIKAIIAPSATTSAGIVSMENRTKEAMMIIMRTIMGRVIGFPLFY
jgi:hypothetical protein